MEAINFNYAAIVVAGLAGVFIGGLWYSPVLFAKSWAGHIGKTAEQVQADFSPLKILNALISCIIAAIYLSAVIDFSGHQSLTGGIHVGLVTAFAVLIVFRGMHDFFEHRPFKLFLITVGHDLLVFVAMGAILGAWQ
ncbi:MAG: DUF1761 domain-containing protein [Acidobacteriota bacterium]